MSFRETQQVIIVLVPYHKRRAYGITIAVLPINLFMLLVVIEVQERYLLVLVYRAFNSVHVINKWTVTPSALIKRNNMLWNALRLVSTKRFRKSLSKCFLLCNGKFRRIDNVRKHNHFCRFKRPIDYIIVMVFLFVGKNIITVVAQSRYILNENFTRHIQSAQGKKLGYFVGI